MKAHCSCRLTEDTEALGLRLGRALQVGDCLALNGELGSGKTTLSRGLALGCEVSDPVTSPSYLLCQEYSGRVPFLHLDAYFSARLEELFAEGMAERFHEAVVVLEWADQVRRWLPEDHLQIALVDTGKGRELVFESFGPRSLALLAPFLEGEPVFRQLS